MSLHGDHGSAWRRRQRRLRSWWRHEQQSVAMALSAAAHHSFDKVAAGVTHDGPRAQRTSRAGEAAHRAPRRQRTRAAGEAVIFELFDEDTAGLWPGVLAEPRPQERVQRHTMEHIVDYVCCAPLVQTLDAPVPQTVDKLHDVLRFFDRLTTVPEQVIEVPKVITEDVPMRAVLRATQLAEQLLEVPTIISFPMIALLHALLAQRTVEQNVDIPAVGGSGTGGGLSGFLPGQNSSMTAEQIVDNPVPRPGGAGDLQGFPRGQGSTALSGRFPSFPIQVAAVKIFSQSRAPQCLPRILLDKLVNGFLALFSGRKKVRRSRAPRGRNWVRTRAHGRRELSWGLFGGMVAQHGVRLLLLVAAKQEWCFLVCSSGPPSYPWLGAADGADCAWEPPVRHGGFWKNFLFYVACLCRAIRTWKSGHCLYPRVFQSFGVWVLPLEHVVFGTRAWFNSGYMFYEWLLANFTYFLRVVHSDRGVPLHSAEWRSVHS